MPYILEHMRAEDISGGCDHRAPLLYHALADFGLPARAEDARD